MANTIRIKRRASGLAGAPAALENAELAFNEIDDTLYYGKGTGGAGGTATTVEPIGGKGAVVMLSGDQTVGGVKTFTSSPVVPAPTADGQAATKKYVDDSVAAVTIPDGDKGDLTVSGSGATWTIDPGAVSNAKMASVATATLKGRASAGSGAPEDLTAAQVKTLLQIGYGDLTGAVPTWNQSTTGSAATLTTARSISITGDATWTTSFNGSANATGVLTLANSGVTAGTYGKVTVDAKGRVTAGAALAAADIPALDASKITTGTLAAARIPTLNQNTTGSAATLTTARTISITGDATWSTSFNGSADVTGALTLANSGVTAGTYTKVTVDAKGRVTGSASLAATDIPTLTAAKISDFATQVRVNSLDQMAAPTAAVSMNGQKLTGLAAPTADSDAATKVYVDTLAQGLDPKASVRAATVVPLAPPFLGPKNIDGVALATGDRVLVKNQANAAENGIYVVQAGEWTRAADADTWEKLVSAFVFVESGTTNADCGFLISVDPGGDLGTTPVTVVQFAGAAEIAAGNGLTKTGNVLAVGAGTGITVGATTVGLTGQALALHNLATNGFFVRTAAGVVAARSIAASGSGVSVANGDGVSGNPTISLSAALSSIGGLTPAADRIPYYTGAGTAALATITAAGRAVLAAANAAAQRAALELGSMATQNSNAVNITGGSIDNITFDGGTF